MLLGKQILKDNGNILIQCQFLMIFSVVQKIIMMMVESIQENSQLFLQIYLIVKRPIRPMQRLMKLIHTLKSILIKVCHNLLDLLELKIKLNLLAMISCKLILLRVHHLQC